MIRRIVSLHPEAIAEGREARLWYRIRSHAVEERFARARVTADIISIPRTRGTRPVPSGQAHESKAPNPPSGHTATRPPSTWIMAPFT